MKPLTFSFGVLTWEVLNRRRPCEGRSFITSALPPSHTFVSDPFLSCQSAAIACAHGLTRNSIHTVTANYVKMSILHVLSHILLCLSLLIFLSFLTCITNCSCRLTFFVYTNADTVFSYFSYESVADSPAVCSGGGRAWTGCQARASRNSQMSSSYPADDKMLV